MRNKKLSGFTFIELLVTVTIIIVLITAGTTTYSQAQKRARDSRRKADMTAMKGALEEYYIANGSVYPDTCSSASTYLAGAWPSDPSTLSYTDGQAAACTTSTYCICATMELTGNGNSANTSCTSWSASGNYYCVQNQQ